MRLLNESIGQLKPSATLSVKAKATELKRAGKEIIDLSTGEPDGDTPDHIKAAASQALAEGKTKYTAVPGILELREAVAEKFTLENHLTSTADTVIITNGGKQALHEVMQVAVNPGDEVIIPAPYWVSYPSMVLLAGGKPVIIETQADQGYRLTAERLADAITDRTRAIIINSPSNPTGAAYTREDFVKLGNVLAEKDILIISDEVYEKIVFDGFEFVSFAAAVPKLADRTVTVNAFSKTYSMTGWRVGYATGPQEIIKAMSKYQSQTTSNVNAPAQYAALAALKGSHDFLVEWKEAFNRRISLAMDGLAEIPGLSVAARPEGAFYLFVRLEELLARASEKFKGSVDVATFLLEEAGVAIVPGEAFGDDGAFRMSVAAADDQIAAGLERIKRALLEVS